MPRYVRFTNLQIILMFFYPLFLPGKLTVYPQAYTRVMHRVINKWGPGDVLEMFTPVNLAEIILNMVFNSTMIEGIKDAAHIIIWTHQDK